MPSRDAQVPAAEVQKRLDELLWYHSIDVVAGAATKGWFDLRHALPLLPFPDVRGKRCLDVGTWDGFYAFELERRGAAEVIALDVEDLTELDYPPAVRAAPGFDPSGSASSPRSAGFHLLHELLESKVQWLAGNIYDLDPDVHGTFDLVVVGSLLVHLRDPMRALDRARRVADGGSLLSIDYVNPSLTLLAAGSRRALFDLRGETADFQWWCASDAGLRQLLTVAGFAIEQTSPYFVLRPGRGEGEAGQRRGRKELVRRALNRALSGDATPGAHLHRAYLGRPSF